MSAVTNLPDHDKSHNEATPAGTSPRTFVRHGLGNEQEAELPQAFELLQPGVRNPCTTEVQCLKRGQPFEMYHTRHPKPS